MNNRSAIRASAIAAMLTGGPGVPRTPHAPKYEGQPKAHLKGAWEGDGSKSAETRQRRRKADRWAKKEAKKILGDG